MPLPNTWVTGQTFTAADADAVADAVNAATIAVAAAYVKPVGGIPSTDMTAAVQASLTAADNSLAAPAVHAATSKTTPVDADEVPMVDSAASFGLKKLTWANLKATIKSYYDSVTSTVTNKDLTSGTNTFPTLNQNTTGSAAKLTTARNINGVAFDGTAPITVADATKEPSITAGSSGQYWDGTKAFLAFPTFNQNTTGSAAKLTTARTINGVSFDGTANILLASSGQWGPSDHGLIAWAFDLPMIAASQIPTSGTVWLVGLKVPAGTITNIILSVATAGSGLTAGQCFAGLYQGGTLLAATADQAAAWASTGTKTMALTTPQTVTAGLVHVAYFSNGTTNPAFARGPNVTAGNVGLSAATSRFGTADTGRTTSFPATLGTITAQNATQWAAVS